MVTVGPAIFTSWDINPRCRGHVLETLWHLRKLLIHRLTSFSHLCSALSLAGFCGEGNIAHYLVTMSWRKHLPYLRFSATIRSNSAPIV